MTYCQQPALTIVAGAYDDQQFRCNGLFDPDVNVGGGQPLYFDQLTAIYNHFTVLSSFIEVQVLGQPTNHNQLMYGVYIDDDTTTVSSATSLMSRPGAVFKICDSTVETPKPIRLGWSAAKTFGNPTPWTDPELQGSASADPVEQSHFTIGLADTTLQNATYLVSVKITYNVMWDELKTIAVS